MSVYKGCSKISNGASFTALVLLAFLIGCGGGGGGTGGGNGLDGGNGGNGGGSGPPDLIAPTVTSMSPGEDSGGSSPTPGMGTNSKLTATLSEAMVAGVITAIDPGTQKPANFRLSDGTITNGAIDYLSGTVSYDAANHVAMFTPATPLAPSTMYTATIITGVKDLAGNALVNDFAWCFVTGATADSTTPSVTSTFPGDAATGVAFNRKIAATFSEEMNPSTLTAASFTVTGPGATPVPGTVTYVARTAMFAPSGGFAANTAYTARAGAGATDLAGNALQAKTWSFTTGANADATAPTVNSTSPAGASVAIGSPIAVTLNEPMDPATITTANFLVTGPGTTPVRGTVAFDTVTNTATFTRHNHFLTPAICDLTPASDLDRNTLYTATLTTGAKDTAGNALASDVVWSFTTTP
jgi:Big-like domain-containing protein